MTSEAQTPNLSKATKTSIVAGENAPRKIWVYDQFNQWICLEDEEQKKKRQEEEERLKKIQEKEERQKEFDTRLQEEEDNREEIEKEMKEWQEEAQKQEQEEKEKLEKEKQEEEEKKKAELQYEEIEDFELIRENDFAIGADGRLLYIVEKTEHDVPETTVVDRHDSFKIQKKDLKKTVDLTVNIHTEDGSYEKVLKVNLNEEADHFFNNTLKEELKKNFSFSSCVCFNGDWKLKLKKKIKVYGPSLDALKKANEELSKAHKAAYDERKKAFDEERAKLLEERKKEQEQKPAEEQQQEQAEGQEQQEEEKQEPAGSATEQQTEEITENQPAGETQNQQQPEVEEEQQAPAEGEAQQPEQPVAKAEEEVKKEEELPEFEAYVPKHTHLETRYNNIIKNAYNLHYNDQQINILRSSTVAQITPLMQNPVLDILITRPTSLQCCQFYDTVLYSLEQNPQICFTSSKPILLSGIGLYGPFPNACNVQAFNFTFSIKNARTGKKELLRAKVVDKDERIYKFFLDEELFVDEGDFVHVTCSEKDGAVFTLTSNRMYFYGDDQDGGVRFAVTNHYRNGIASVYYRRVE